MLTYAEAEALFSTARDKHAGKPLGNNTRLHRRHDGEGKPPAYAVRLHYTDVVTIRADGTYELNSNGWHTVTTQSRIHWYSPARVYSDGGIWHVHAAGDPVTPPKIRKCRVCHGAGTVIRTHGWRDGSEAVIEKEYRNPDMSPMTYSHRLPHETYAEYHTRQYAGKLHAPIVKLRPRGYGLLDEPETVACGNCGGDGTRDYGSKRNPAAFYDGIIVDSQGSVVAGQPVTRRYAA